MKYLMVFILNNCCWNITYDGSISQGIFNHFVENKRCNID